AAPRRRGLAPRARHAGPPHGPRERRSGARSPRVPPRLRLGRRIPKTPGGHKVKKLFLSVVALAAVAALAPAASGADLQIGAPAPDFALPNSADGKVVALKDLLAKNKAVAVIFVATKCPVSNAYNDRMAALGRDYTAKGIAVVGINANKTEPAAEVAEHAK